MCFLEVFRHGRLYQVKGAASQEEIIQQCFQTVLFFSFSLYCVAIENISLYSVYEDLGEKRESLFNF